MFVNDGVCDYDLCCDGSEEYSKVGGVKCQNRCAEIGKEWRRVEKERKDNLEKANKKRRTMAKESKELRRQVEAKIEKLAAEIKELEHKRDDLKKKYDDVERSERGKIVKDAGTGKLGQLVVLARGRVNELRDALGLVINQRDELKVKVAELEGILAAFKEEYNPNFNDEGVKKAVRSFEDYAAKVVDQADNAAENDVTEVLKEDSESNGINWAEYDDVEVTDTDIRKLDRDFPPRPSRTTKSTDMVQSITWKLICLALSGTLYMTRSISCASGSSKMECLPTALPEKANLAWSLLPAKLTNLSSPT